jgi:hypothetical protein
MQVKISLIANNPQQVVATKLATKINGHQGLSSGAVIAIAVGSFWVVSLIGLLSWYCVRRRRKSRMNQKHIDFSFYDDKEREKRATIFGGLGARIGSVRKARDVESEVCHHIIIPSLPRMRWG